MTTRTELIARLRGRIQSNYYSLQDMKDALAMLEADERVIRPALEYVDAVPDDRDNAEHIDRDALVAAMNGVLK